jgi:hypothetical protein
MFEWPKPTPNNNTPRGDHFWNPTPQVTTSMVICLRSWKNRLLKQKLNKRAPVCHWISILTTALSAHLRIQTEPPACALVFPRKQTTYVRWCNSRLTLRAQGVDATPSGIKLFSKVVFVISRKSCWHRCGHSSFSLQQWRAASAGVPLSARLHAA